ncbi:MAG TPA: hypothetical protein VNK67_08060, partial [Burkholderiales bacterium]|nr:hypothetical protein [Burkholderiales bacterium]
MKSPHRYAAIVKRAAIEPAFEAQLGVIDEVFPVERRDTERAKEGANTCDKSGSRGAQPDGLSSAVANQRVGRPEQRVRVGEEPVPRFIPRHAFHHRKRGLPQRLRPADRRIGR